MEINVFHLIFLLAVWHAEAKAFYNNQHETNEGNNYGHMYENMYLNYEKPQESYHSPSNVNQDYGLRYVPHVYGRPIFIPPTTSSHYDSVVPSSFHRRRTRPHPYWHSINQNSEDMLGNDDGMFIKSGVSVNYENPVSLYKHKNIKITPTVPMPYEYKKEHMSKTDSYQSKISAKPKHKVNYSNPKSIKYSSEGTKYYGKGNKASDINEETLLGDLNDYAYDDPTVIQPSSKESGTEIAKETEDNKYTKVNTLTQEAITPKAPAKYDHSEVVTDMAEKDLIIETPNKVLSDKTNVREDTKDSILNDESIEMEDYYDDYEDDYEIPEVIKTKKTVEDDYDSPEVIEALTKKKPQRQGSNIQIEASSKSPINQKESNVYNPNTIELSKKDPNLNKQSDIIEVLTEKPQDQKVYEKITVNYNSDMDENYKKERPQYSIKRRPINMKPQNKKSYTEDSDVLLVVGRSVKENPIKINYDLNSQSQSSNIRKNYQNSAVVETMSKNGYDLKDYYGPSTSAMLNKRAALNEEDDYDNPDVVEALTKKKQTQKEDEYDRPVVVESLTKKKPVSIEDEYDSPDVIQEIIQKPNNGDNEYDRPVIVETLIKKPANEDNYDSPVVVESLIQKPTNEDDYDSPTVIEVQAKKHKFDDGDDYESPVVVETLTKKKPVNKKENTVTTKETTIKESSDDLGYDVPVVVEALTKKDTYSPKVTETLTKKVETKTGHVITIYKNPDLVDVKSAGYASNKEQNEIIEPNKPPTKPDFEVKNEEKFPLELGSGSINEKSDTHENKPRGLFSDLNVWSLMSSFHSQERNKFRRCQTPKNESGNCMPIQMCPVPNLSVTLDDLLKKVCVIDDVFIGICCPEFPAETLKVDWENLEQNSNDEVDSLRIDQRECGQIPESGKEIQSWPWMAPLISVSTRKIFCGGVLINERYVLTAAHCTRRIPHNQILVILGPIGTGKGSANQEFAVVQIKRHAQYNPRTMQNDIALLKLSRTVPLGDFSRFICLPNEVNYVGQEAVMLGWQGSFAASKKVEPLRVISSELCRRQSRMVVGENLMCTEPRSEDTMCNLDSGAPLIIKRNGKYEVIGILTWNRNDCDSRFPAIFNRVSHFRKWIENHST